jgi:hypothetical protein
VPRLDVGDQAALAEAAPQPLHGVVGHPAAASQVAFGRQARARLELSRLDAAQAQRESVVPYGITWPGSRPS